jgi:hypothetical protein
MKNDAPDRLASSSDDTLLREMLDAGKTELPDDAQLAAVARRLGPILGGPGGATGAAPRAASRWAVAAKGVAVAAVVAGAVAVVARVVGAPPPAPAVSAAPALPSSHAAIPSAFAEPVESAVPGAAAEATTTPAPRQAAPRPSQAAPRASPEEDETQLLERAEDALAANPTRALALADEHAHRFAGGMLRQEGEVIAIDALVRLGRRDAAVARALSFRRTYPASTHLRRIDVILAHD